MMSLDRFRACLSQLFAPAYASKDLPPLLLWQQVPAPAPDFVRYGQPFEYSRPIGMVVMGPDGIYWCWPLSEHDKERWLAIEADPYHESKVQGWQPLPQGMLP